MNPYSLSVLLFGFGILLSAFFAASKDLNRTTVRFSFFSVVVGVWAFVYTIWTGYDFDPKQTMFLVKASEFFAIFIPPLWLHFVLEFVGRKEKRKWEIPFCYLTSVVLLFLCPTTLFFEGLREVPVFNLYKSAGPILYVFFAFFCFCVLRAFYEMVRAYRLAEGVRREQLGYLLIGWGTAFIGGTATFLPAFGITQFYALFFLMPLYPVFTGMALIRYGYLDLTKITESFHKDKLAAIGTLSACINHEIRNPLFIIDGTARIYLEDRPGQVLDPAVNAALQAIAEQSRRALDIMKNLSDFTKQEIGNAKPEKSAVCVRKALEDVKPLIVHELENSRIRLCEELPETLSSVDINKRHFEEILFNLLLNACQAICRHTQTDAQREVRVHAAQKNGSVLLQIKDSGPGISEAQLPRIFEPFYSTREAGSGLGLFITKRLVERNGGKIFVHSREGEGTTFRLTLPRA